MHESPSRAIRIAVAASLALATAAVYASVLRASFLTFDDPVYVTKNDPVLAGLTLDGLRWAFSTGEGGNWHPLTWLSHMLDVQLFGLRAAGHHATSLVFHVANSVLLLVALDRLTHAFWRSSAVAALFALHPLHVESVAWVSERKDVLSTFFLLLVLLAYARYAERPGRGRYAAVLVLYVMGLMSKPMLVTLPFVLVLLDFWPLGRMARLGVRRVLAEKLPLFALAALASAATYHFQRVTGAVAPTDALPLPVRASNAIASLGRYLAKTVWPARLSPYYPHPKVIELGPALVGATVLLVVTALAVRERKRRPYIAVGWLWFVGTLVPVIGLVQVGAQAMADRYTYVPLIGVFLAAAWSVPAPARAVPISWIAALGIATPVLVALALVTRFQVGLWTDMHTLFAHAVAVTKENSMAQKCLADGLLMEGKFEEAIPHFREAVRITPLLVDGHNNLGVALGGLGRFDEASAEYRKELEIRPFSAETRFNLASALMTLGRIDEAIAEFEETLRIAPRLGDAHSKLGAALGTRGRFAEAERHFREVLAIDPGSAGAHFNLGVALVNQGCVEEGVAEYHESLRLDPEQFNANQKLGVALGSLGRLGEALAAFRKALDARPDDVETRRSFAVTLTLLGNVEEAINHYRKLLEADEKDLDAMNAIAWIRATHADPAHRNATEAVDLAQRARDASPEENSVLFDTLAAAYAEAGRYGDAVAACEKAIELSRSKGDDQTASRCEQQLELFRAQKPFRIR